MLALLFFISTCFVSQLQGRALSLPEKSATEIGMRIWNNECGGKIDNLTWWNTGEDFASMGIGHFIWYPEGKTGPFEEQFLKLLSFFEENSVTLPIWLQQSRSCPWKSKQEFDEAREGEELKQLRFLLANTIQLQVEFMTERLEAALPRILEAAKTSSSKEKISNRFYRIAKTGVGPYVLLDYVNFKGEGVSASERYQAQGWGLLQVLEAMKDSADPISDFVESAKRLLKCRVENAPPERGESRWLSGWYNRLDTYKRPLGSY